jgi:hypothetical protein
MKAANLRLFTVARVEPSAATVDPGSRDRYYWMFDDAGRGSLGRHW